jgi:DNA gyrase/topoisomerase IV subunit A
MYKCKYCDKNYASYSSRSNHVKLYHNDLIINVNNNKLPSNVCQYCNNEFCDRVYRWKHEKICPVKKEQDKQLKEQEITQKIKTIENEKEALENEKETLKKQNQELKNLLKTIHTDKELINKQLDKIDNQIPIKRKPLPATVRHSLWKDHFHTSTEGICKCCNREKISSVNFEAGHIISVIKGGSNKLSNLKPICSFCNKSMGTKNMNEFIIEHGLQSSI